MASRFIQGDMLHGHVRVYRIMPVAAQSSVIQGARMLHGVCGRVFRVVHGDEAWLHSGRTAAERRRFRHEHRPDVTFRQQLARRTFHHGDPGGLKGDHGSHSCFSGRFRTTGQGKQGGGFQQKSSAVHALDFLQHGLELTGKAGKISGDGGNIAHTEAGEWGIFSTDAGKVKFTLRFALLLCNEKV